MEFNVDDDKQFEKFMNDMIDKQTIEVNKRSL